MSWMQAGTLILTIACLVGGWILVYAFRWKDSTKAKWLLPLGSLMIVIGIWSVSMMVTPASGRNWIRDIVDSTPIKPQKGLHYSHSGNTVTLLAPASDSQWVKKVVTNDEVAQFAEEDDEFVLEEGKPLQLNFQNDDEEFGPLVELKYEAPTQAQQNQQQAPVPQGQSTPPAQQAPPAQTPPVQTPSA